MLSLESSFRTRLPVEVLVVWSVGSVSSPDPEATPKLPKLAFIELGSLKLDTANFSELIGCPIPNLGPAEMLVNDCQPNGGVEPKPAVWVPSEDASKLGFGLPILLQEVKLRGAMVALPGVESELC